MKRIAAIFVFLLSVLYGHAQRVQIIVPRQVVAGNAFQIQYVINDPSSFETISTPQFDNLQLISGPNYYRGNSSVSGKTQAIENITYTVMPLNAGLVRIAPVTAKFKNGHEEITSEVKISAIPQPKASFNALSTYTDINLYAPSSKTDLDKLVEANLFIKTEVDKRICFLGEAITATFKLYSRLQSTSEVINAPSLYGFSVMDVLNVNEAHGAVETIHGKIFNTSILRKLQLYPAQTGKLTIDPMQLQNTIEFDDSTGGKTRVEKLLASKPVEITVKPLPSTQPASFTGAVGQFKISVNLPNSKIEANTQGKLVVTISGKGNFIQFGPPVIQWPKALDVFDPLVQDDLNKNSSPTEGTRNYIFNFTTNEEGDFIIPPVRFSFFDPATRQFRQDSSDSLHLQILPVTNDKKAVEEEHANRSGSNSWVLLSAILILALLATIFILQKRKHETAQTPLLPSTNYLQKLNEIVATQHSGKTFCLEVQKLSKALIKDHSLSPEQKQELETIERDCQLLIYSDIESEGKKEELQKRVENLFRQLEA